MTKYTSYVEENVHEEYAVLVGRIEALAAYMESSDSNYVNKDVIYAMLGLEVSENGRND